MDSERVANNHHPANDFDGDGLSDILWRNDDGTITVWLGHPNVGFGIPSASDHLLAGWEVVGTGDFNGDGRSDVLLRNGGSLAEWTGQPGGTFFDNPYGNYLLSGDWQVAGTGEEDLRRRLVDLLLRARGRDRQASHDRGGQDHYPRAAPDDAEVVAEG